MMCIPSTLIDDGGLLLRYLYIGQVKVMIEC